jgi:hypothetical protein
MSNSDFLDLTALNLQVEIAFAAQIALDPPPAFLQAWEDTLPNKLQPVFPPAQVPGCPHYRYNAIEYNCRFRLAAFPSYLDAAST